MRIATRRRRSTDRPPGVIGVVRLDRRTTQVARRLRPGEIAVVDHVDLDRGAAQALLACGAAAVVNVAPSVSGRYPALGPELLVQAGVPLLDDVGSDLFGVLRDGDEVRLHEDTLYAGDGRVLATGRRQTLQSVDADMAAARAGMTRQLEAFAAGTAEFLRRQPELLLEGVGLPRLATSLAGRPALVVGGGPRQATELRQVRRWLRDTKPVLVGVGSGADVLLAARMRPDVVVGAPAELSEAAVRSGAEVIAHGPPDGPLPGLGRVHELGVEAAVLRFAGSAEDAALLLVHASDASVVVTAGVQADLVELLDHGHTGMASAVLTGLRVGSRVVDAPAAANLRRRRTPRSVVVALAAAAVVVAGVGLFASPAGAGLRRWTDTTLSGHTDALTSQTARLTRQAAADRSLLAAEQRYDAAAAPGMIGGRLSGRTVAVVSAPGVPAATRAAMLAALHQAGATVTADVRLAPAYVDPAQSAEVGQLATELASGAGSLPAGPGAQRADVEIAAALTAQPGQAGMAGPRVERVLSAFADAKLLTLPGGVPSAPATLAVLIVPPPGAGSADTPAARRAQLDSLLPLARDLDKGSAGAVLAGPVTLPGTPGGVVTAARADRSTARTVPVVDGVGLPAGRVATVLALAGQPGPGGSYGVSAATPLPSAAAHH